MSDLNAATLELSRADQTRALRAFLDASPTPWHAAESTRQILTDAGFVEVNLAESFPSASGSFFVRRGGSLIAWRSSRGVTSSPSVRIVAAHTDSPGFRIKPRPESSTAGCVRLGVEVYGGPLLNSWLDRELGLAGTVLVGNGRDLEVRPVIDRRAVLRIPQLAIHLDRGVNETGLKLDKQQHIQLIWRVGGDSTHTFAEEVARLADVAPTAVRAWDLAPFDLTPAAVCGPDDELLASARLDDLLSCHAALEAFIGATEAGSTIPVLVLVDHEEVGSTTANGANSQFVSRVIRRITADVGWTHSGVADSAHAISLDMAHATHPNYPERHDPLHTIALDGGPVIKHNAQQRYATSVESMAPFLAACDEAHVPVQDFVSHSEMPCGSTIGPALASGLGIPVVDVGVPQLAMHSAREVCGSQTHAQLTRALTAYLSLP